MKRLLAIIAFCLSLSPAVAQFNGCGTGFCPSVFGSGFPATSSSPVTIDLNFATATYSGCALTTCVTIVRATSKTDLLPTSSSGLQFNTFSSNVLAITPTLGLLLEDARTNQLLNNCNATTYPTQCAGNTGPANQTTGSLANGTYTLWVNGSGSAQMGTGTATGCGTGTASQGTPVSFTTSGAAGTCTVTVTGSLNFFQLEAGAFGTSGIITTGSALARNGDNVKFASTALTTIQGTNFFVVMISGALSAGASAGILEGTTDNILKVASNTTVNSIFGVTTLTATLGSGTYSAGPVKTALSVGPSVRSLVANNGTLVTDAHNISANAAIGIGGFNGTIDMCDCYISRSQLGPTTPSNATLAGCTTAGGC